MASRPFCIGINMPGAVSAGAYTAGVLDFLIQALDEWEAAKNNGQAVPGHNIRLEVLSGASAGGMCGAISAVALYEDFDPIDAAASEQQKQKNKLYKSWVRDIDIQSLLGTEDLPNKNASVVSLLDSTCIPKIAENVITGRSMTKKRSYVSDNLTLFLTLTNLRGVPYSMDTANQGSFEEHINYYPDQLRFEIVQKSGDALQSPIANPLPLSEGNNDWQLLQKAAVGTGAFPIALAPMVLDRRRNDYNKLLWTVRSSEPTKSGGACENEAEIPPAWPSGLSDSIVTLNVDGGATNNNPFELCRKYLASRGEDPKVAHNPRGPMEADRAVITVAPFPSDEPYTAEYKADQKCQLFSVAGSLVGALLSQSRFQGESLSLVKDRNVFSRFVVAPSDPDHRGQPALMSSPVSAFGGFLDPGFRDHDFQLGRYNCQWFLKQYFVLPLENPVIASGLQANQTAIIEEFRASNDAAFNRSNVTNTWIPIVPLCGRAKTPISVPVRIPTTRDRVEEIADQSVKRIRAILPRLAESGFISGLISVGGWLFQWKLKSAIKDYLLNSLGRNVSS